MAGTNPAMNPYRGNGTTMAEVSCRNVVKEYEGGVQAVKGIDLDIADHEFVVLVGPSGCGKSTTLRMIAGLEEITAGEIWIGGDVVNDIPPRDRDIAMVFQNYALYPHMSVFDNMAFGLKLRKFPKDEIKRRVDEAARILDIGPLLQRKPRALSGGQRQRVAMGRAIVRNPKVFLFDEPLSNLDAKLRVQMRTEIKKVHQTVRTTTVYVTHDQIEAMTLADRVVVMNGGIIEQVGTPQQLYHHPSTRFVAGFIGSPAMNFLPCRVQEGANGTLAVKVNEAIVLPVPAERTDRYGKFKGRDMVLGLRPEHLFEYHEQGKVGWARVDLPVDVVEPMGMETMVHFFVDGAPVCARVDPATHAAPGETLPLTADLNQMHLMEPATGAVV
jgi:multiple sugar transport system ATP-binding protein